MTATELQSIVRSLANSTWCRYWLNFYNSPTDVYMAIQCRDETGKPEPVAWLFNNGFVELDQFTSPLLYFIKRTNEDGTDFESKLF